MAASLLYSPAVLAGVCPDHYIPAGVVLSRTGTYTATAAHEVLSVLQLIPMPKGAQLLNLLIAWSALGLGRSMDIGLTDIDSFFDGLVTVNAGQAQWGCAIGGTAADTFETIVHGVSLLAATWPYKFTANDTIDVKFLGDTFPSAGVVTGVAFYKMEGGIADET